MRPEVRRRAGAHLRALRRVLRRGFLDETCAGSPRLYLRLAGSDADLRRRVFWPKARWQDEPGVVCVGLKLHHLRPFAEEVARLGLRVLRWRTPRAWAELSADVPDDPGNVSGDGGAA